ncbi:MAG TPA: ABC transporter permease [Phycisphaerales bacterium]|nr:ABC transporter permease [Phycisphaerales bacterium]HMP36250.1 ABC transporter permease [Phycisphaerales bacterium]
MGFFLEIVRLGLNNLRLHMLRTVLTSLGIILGVAAVIIMVSIGEGNKQAALREITALGATNIIVRSVKPAETTSMGGQARSFLVNYGLRREDQRRLDSGLPDAIAVVPLKAAGSEMSAGAVRMTSQVFGTTPDLAPTARLRVARGRYLTDEDLRGLAPVAVIGHEVAEKFFPLRDPVGADFRIDDRVFRVVGVLEPVGLAGGTGSALVGRDLNFDVHIPVTTTQASFGDIVVRRASGSMTGEQIELSELYIVADSTESVLGTAARVRRIVEVGHPGFTDVQVIVPWELLENAKRTALIWNIVLISIAAISLVVGGIGIMNIMLASVTERTREIGIRRALGATRRHIVVQFLVETGALSAVGGLLGIVLGVGASLGVERIVPWLLARPLLRRFIETSVSIETEVTMWSIVVSFLVAAIVGLVFGIYPAIVASRQDPIVALRHD